jgi:uncharacterized protein (TIGR02099 family)
MPFPRSKPLKYCLVTLASVAVLFGLLIGAFQIAVTRVPEYRVHLQDWISERTGLVIEFRKLSARLRRYGPELVFDDAVVRTGDRTRVLVSAKRGSVAFDLWTSIAARRLTAGRFTLDSPELGLIRTRAGRVQLVGQDPLAEEDEWEPIAVDSLPVGQFHVRNAVVGFRDEATGRGPWSVSGVNFRLDRQTELLELHGDATLPQALGKSLEFSARVVGPLEQVDGLTSTFSIEGERLDLAGWADVLPDTWPVPETGRGNIELSSTFNGVRLSGVTARLDLADLSAAPPTWITDLPAAAPLIPKEDPDAADRVEGPIDVETGAETSTSVADEATPQPAELISFDRLALVLNAVHEADSWRISVSDLDLSGKSAPWRKGKIDASWSESDSGGVRFALNSDRLVLENLWPLLAYVPESENAARLRALRAGGTVDDLTLNFAREHAAAPPTYSVSADIRDLRLRPVLKVPGLAGITAHVQGNEAGGTISVDSKSVAFELPWMFRSALSANSLRGSLDWQRVPEGWRIDSRKLEVRTEDGDAEVAATVTIPVDRSSPILDLQARARNLNVASTSRYLPANKLTLKTLAWLDQAFVKGVVADADVKFRGPTHAFPFRRREGEFVARAHVTETTFNYQPGWAPATNVTANVEFRNKGMKVLSGTADVGGLKVTEVRGDFPDFKAGNLAVNAQATGDLGQALTLLQTSPIREAFSEQFRTLRGQGPTQSSVSLHLPLRHMADRRIAVTTILNDATVSLSAFDAPLTELSGTLTVRQALPAAAKLQGHWLGGPVEISVHTPDSGDASVVTVSGRAIAGRMSPLLHVPSNVALSGAADWQLTTELRRAESAGTSQSRKFTLESSLEGLGVGLPYPLGKSDQEARPLRIELEYNGDNAWLARSAMGDLRALVRVERGRNGWRFDRGSVRADAIAAALPAHGGLRIEGSIDRLNLDDWLGLKGNSGGSTRLSDYLHAANLRIGMLQVFGYQFPDVRGMLQSTGSSWRVDVAGSNAEGELTVPEDLSGAEALTVKLDRLLVSRGGKQGEQLRGRDPRSWPNLRAFVGDLRIDDHAAGAVDLQVTRMPTGIRVDSLTIVQEAVRAEARGQWLITPDGERSEITARVTSTDVAASLRALNYTPFMEARRGEISAELAWSGGFDSDALGRASGKVAIEAENGQLLSVQPGAGRMLGLFSVAALPRRLALDFSDLTDKGLSFDTVHGDFELRDGNAYTSNLLLRGPAAEIGIAGRTGLSARDYDQTAVVTGNLGASLPVAGALAGGPAVGAALLLFTQVFKEPLKGIARGYYRITGPWENPVVERVDAAEIKEATAESNRLDR